MLRGAAAVAAGADERFSAEPLADLVLKPDFDCWVSLSREFSQRAIAAGYRDTLAQAGALRALRAR